MSTTHAAIRAASQLLMAALGILAMPVAALAATGPPLPSWPQNFYVNAMERESFGLPVTAAGVIAVSLQAQGAPIVVLLTRPDGTVAQQVGGTGALRMSYGATAAEVAGSPLWHIGVALQQPAPGNEARGSVEVQEPPIDAQALAAFLARPKAPRPRPDTAALAAQNQAKVEATKRAFEQARAAHQAALFEAIRPRFEAAKARAAQQVSTRAVLPANVVKAPNTAMLAVPPVQRMPLNLPPPPPPPVISLPLFIDHGEPGDPISISGSAFGQGAGTVHFVLGTTPWTGTSTGDVIAPVSTWTETEIFTSVPTVVGYSLPTVVGLYVLRNDGTASASVPFNFYPTMDLKVYPTPPQSPQDSVIGNYDAGYCSSMATQLSQQPWGAGCENYPYPVNGWACSSPTWFPCDGAGGTFTGYKANDIFFQTAHLKNAWVVDHVDAAGGDLCFGSIGGGCGAYVWPSDPPLYGTNSLRVNIRVWADADALSMNHPTYSLMLYIRGPKGVPFQ